MITLLFFFGVFSEYWTNSLMINYFKLFFLHTNEVDKIYVINEKNFDKVSDKLSDETLLYIFYNIMD